MDIPGKLVYDNRQVVHFKSVSSVFVFWVNLMIGKSRSNVHSARSNNLYSDVANDRWNRL